MEQSTRAGLQNSGTETRLRQVISHLHIQSPDEPVCQICGEPPTEGDQIILYLYKPAGSAKYSIGQCRCRSHDDNLPSLFTLGVRELMVDGRIGQCRDHATQQMWPVLIDPSIRLISAQDTTSGRVVSDPQSPTPNSPQGQATDDESDNPDPISSNHQSLSLSNQGGSVERTAAQSVGSHSDG